MKTFLLAAVTVAAAFATPAHAHDYKKGDIIVKQVWANTSAGQMADGAAYMTIVNKGAAPDKLIGVKTKIATKAELHTHLMEGGVMKMREVEGGIVVGNEAPTEFAPGGLHIMFLGLKDKLSPGQTFPMVLVFEKGGELPVKADVLAKAPSRNDAPDAAPAAKREGQAPSGQKKAK